MSADERLKFDNFDDGNYVLLTNKNSRGFVEGIYKAIDIIKAEQVKASQKQ